MVSKYNVGLKTLLLQDYSEPEYYCDLVYKIRRHFDMVSKYNVGLKTLLLQGFSEPEFYGDLVYKIQKVKIIGKNDFHYHFKKIIVRYEKIGYNVLRCFATDGILGC